jgi:hypothetical protein
MICRMFILIIFTFDLIIIMILTKKIFKNFSQLEAGRLFTWSKGEPLRQIEIP